MTVTVDVWAVVGGMGTLAIAIAWLVYLELRYRGRERDLQAHELLCLQRYAAIEARSVASLKAFDDRHLENVERFHDINRHLERQDDKLDRLLARGNASIGGH